MICFETRKPKIGLEHERRKPIQQANNKTRIVKDNRLGPN